MFSSTVKYYKGLEKNFNIKKHKSGIYVCVDTHKVFIEGVPFESSTNILKYTNVYMYQPAEPVNKIWIPHYVHNCGTCPIVQVLDSAEDSLIDDEEIVTPNHTYKPDEVLGDGVLDTNIVISSYGNIEIYATQLMQPIVTIIGNPSAQLHRDKIEYDWHNGSMDEQIDGSAFDDRKFRTIVTDNGIKLYKSVEDVYQSEHIPVPEEQ